MTTLARIVPAAMVVITAGCTDGNDF